jgi:hypothetical protein
MNDCFEHTAGELPSSPALFHDIYALQLTGSARHGTRSAQLPRGAPPVADLGLVSFAMKTFLLGLAALLFLPISGFADEKNTIVCAFWSTGDPSTAELQPRGKCAYMRGTRIFVSSAALSKLVFSKKGLASVFAENHGWLFVRRNGSTIPAFFFDNGPDYFVEGLARYIANGKIGFINESGDIVIRANFQHAFQFCGGRSVVCNGCTKVRNGEYLELKGGLWGCIDSMGKIIIPVKYSEDDARKMIRELESRASG